MPDNATLTSWPKDLPEWDSLSWEEKKLFTKQADVFGAYLAYTDNEIGRVIQSIEDLGELDNTLIIYIAGDNGASAEGMTATRYADDEHTKTEMTRPLCAYPQAPKYRGGEVNNAAGFDCVKGK